MSRPMQHVNIKVWTFLACVIGLDATRFQRYLLDQGYPPHTINKGRYHWADWTSWSKCDGTCETMDGLGQRKRSRYCFDGTNVVMLQHCKEPYSTDDDSPVVIRGVSTLDGPLFGEDSPTQASYREYGYKLCAAQHCPISGWSSWTDQGECSSTCGSGVQLKVRQCNNPQNGSLDCSGSSQELRTCYKELCAIDGGWSSWADQGECSSTCGTGVQLKMRQCNNPAPQNGGLNCSDRSQDFRTCSKGLCPVDGGWSNFKPMQCSATCGIGVFTYVRTCTNPSPANGGKSCTGLAHNFTHCHIRDCAVDGGWTNWNDWSACPVTSGISLHSRIRQCTNPSPNSGGKYCAGDTTESKECIVNIWSSWSIWNRCSVTCGDGTTARTRTCLSHNDCTGETIEYGSCTMPRCLHIVDGAWGTWSNWSECSNSCGNGAKSRVRLCDNPVPQDGGLNCAGQHIDNTTCFLKNCPIDDGWGAFHSLTCSVTCGKGVIISVRTCDNPTPQFGGKECEGFFHEVQDCQLTQFVSDCAELSFKFTVDGSWGAWSNWTSCCRSCGNGTQTRARMCDSPLPLHNGHICTGKNNETQDCFIKECPIDGGWSEFHNISCSVTCGRGQHVAVRYCTNPVPQFGGKDCDGLSHQITECVMPLCAIDGNWSQWSQFSKCGSVCGDGYTLRYRTCSSPAPESGGKNCIGDPEQKFACNNGPCLVGKR